MLFVEFKDGLFERVFVCLLYEICTNDRHFIMHIFVTFDLFLCLCPKQQGYDFIEKVGDGMDSTVDHQMNISEMLVKKPEEIDINPNPFEDNRFMDNVSDHFVSSVAANHFEQQNEHFEDDEPELPNKIDIAEKKSYGMFSHQFVFFA